MKKTILSLCLLTFCFVVFSQDTTWTKTDANLYGSPKEKREQTALWNKAGYELYRLIGFKEYYANGIASYLQTNGFHMENSKDIKGGAMFVFTPRISMGSQPKLYFKYWVNADKRITKVVISGYPHGLASLFVNYWPTDVQWSSTESLKKGVVASKMLIDETITYNNKGAAPFIEISK